MKPTHTLKILNKSNGHSVVAGYGWLNEDKSISLNINPCIVIDDNDKLTIHLFPNDKKP